MSNSLLLLIGRILLAIIFILGGFGKLTAIGGTAGYFGSIGLPLPTVTAVVVGLWELLGGLALLVGFKTRIAAGALALFCVVSALIAHFDFSDQMQMTNFLKNIAMAGGFLALAAAGAGKLSVDGRNA